MTNLEKTRALIISAAERNPRLLELALREFVNRLEKRKPFRAPSKIARWCVLEAKRTLERRADALKHKHVVAPTRTGQVTREERKRFRERLSDDLQIVFLATDLLQPGEVNAANLWRALREICESISYGESDRRMAKKLIEAYPSERRFREAMRKLLQPYHGHVADMAHSPRR